MSEHVIPELDTAGLRKFGLVTAAAFVVIFGLFLPWLFSFKMPIWPWILAAVLVGMALLAPDALGPVYKIWMKFALLLNKITTPLILGIIFFLVFFPAGILMKLFRGDPMKREIEPDSESYRVESKNPESSRMENPF